MFVSPPAALIGIVIALVFGATRSFTQGTSTAYAVFAADGRKTLPFRTSNGVDMVTLDQVAPLFGLTVSEDAVTGGLTIRGRGQPIVLLPGQSVASIGPGRIVSLSAQVQNDRRTWQVPMDFLSKAIGPAMNVRIEIRRPTHTVLIGDVRLPQITARFEKQPPNARLTLEITPPAPHRITREGNRLVIRFEAVLLDVAPISGLAPEFITGTRVDGPAISLDLGSPALTFRATDIDDNHLAIDLMPPPPPPPPTPPPAAATSPAAAAPPPLDLALPGAIRTIVIDPGHGGDDAGARANGGPVEKDYVLQFARRLRATIESRIGVRVLLTRDADENPDIDRRTALANNNKADLFISLHANASVRATTRGAQVLSLRLEDYKNRISASTFTELPVPVVGGGTRAIDVVPWDLAQVPFATKSSALALSIARQFSDRGVAMYARPTAQLPLRTLVGANMPAVLIELGFLTNADDARALAGNETSAAMIDGIVAAILDMRRGMPTPVPGARP